MAPLFSVSAEHWSPGRMTYDLRRLRLNGLIECIPRSRPLPGHRAPASALRYQLTYARAALAAVFDGDPPRSNRLQRTVEAYESRD